MSEQNYSPPGFCSEDTSYEQAFKIPSLNLGLPKNSRYEPKVYVAILQPRTPKKTGSDLSGLTQLPGVEPPRQKRLDEVLTKTRRLLPER